VNTHAKFCRIDFKHPFVAIDFETADCGMDSACAVALVRVEGEEIVDRRHALLRPPRRHFEFTYLHGISWDRVKDQPTFAAAWLSLQSILDGARFLAAHNSGFDGLVLRTCCENGHIQLPSQPFLCTVALARRVLGIYPTKLPDVCRRLGLHLKHHDPCSDAEACARIVLAARKRQ
jgi:DNA polymerase-3 subunit epsilon